MITRVSILFLVYVVLCFASAEVGIAGFFEQLVEEGKKKLKEETDKAIRPIPTPVPQTAPNRASQDQSPTGSQPLSSASMGTQESDNPPIGVPRVKMALGIPIVSKSRAVLSQREMDALQRYVDYLGIGLMANLVDARAKCFAEKYLPQADGVNYINPARRVMPMTSEHTFWKGSNEFEEARSRQAFIVDNMPKLKGAAINSPVRLVIIEEGSLGVYDAKENGFKVRFNHRTTKPQQPNLLVSLEGLCSGALVFRTPLTTHLDGKLYGAWSVSATEAEQLVQRRGQQPIYWGIIVELSAQPKVGYTGDPKEGGSIQVDWPETQVVTKSVGIYEDQELERPLHIFEGGSNQGASPGSATERQDRLSGSQSLAQAASSSQASQASVGKELVPYNVRKLNERPVFENQEFRNGDPDPGRWSRAQLAFSRYVDFIDMGTSKKLLENGAACFLEYHAPNLEWSKYMSKEVSASPNHGKWRLAASSPGLLSFWKGSNEFERARSKQAFIDDYRASFEAAQVKMPLELVVVDSVKLGTYDMNGKSFLLNLSSVSAFANKARGFCGGLWLAYPNVKIEKWDVDPAKAEEILKRLPSRTVIVGATVELSPVVSDAGTGDTYIKTQGYIATVAERPLIRVTVKSIGLYEDPDLEKVLHVFDLPEMKKQ